MKRSQHKSILMGFLLCCWLCGGCRKEVIIPDLEGNLVGYLITSDEYLKTLDDHSNVHVTTKGLDGSYSAYSDAKGRYEFSNLPAGTYDLTFEKEGFEKIMYLGVKHLGGKPTILGRSKNGSIYPFTHLYQDSKSTVQNIRLDGNWIIAEFAAGDGKSHYQFSILIFLSDQDGFNYSSGIIQSYTFHQQDNGDYVALFNKEGLDFTEGQTVYCKAAVVPEYLGSCVPFQNDDEIYYSCGGQLTIYPTIGNVSGQFSFVFPG